MRTLNASQFKAHCLAVLDEVAATGETVTITKRGKPVARLVPPTVERETYPQERLRGTVRIHGDVVAPVIPAEDWDAVRGELS
jgi:prevent-host-death family protein